MGTGQPVISDMDPSSLHRLPASGLVSGLCAQSADECQYRRPLMLPFSPCQIARQLEQQRSVHGLQARRTPAPSAPAGFELPAVEGTIAVREGPKAAAVFPTSKSIPVISHSLFLRLFSDFCMTSQNFMRLIDAQQKKSQTHDNINPNLKAHNHYH